MDHETLFASVVKTGRVVIVQEGHLFASVAAEVAARIQQACFDWLDAPILRVQNRDLYQPYTTELENLAMPRPERIVEACKKVTGK